MAFFLGIDVGSSSVKLTCIDEDGGVVAVSNETYCYDEPCPGWREINPEEWWDAVCAASSKLGDVVDLEKIGGVGVTGQMHTTVLVDEHGAPVVPAIMWNDQRTIESIPSEKKWALAKGLPWLSKLIATGIPAINLSWVKRNNPVAFERAASFLTPYDWIAFKLGARFGMDYCGASTSGLFDNEALSWSKDACEHFGVPERLLPQIDGADSIVGCISDAASNETGISSGALIVRGTGDNPASAICTGCLLWETPTISIGTSGVLMHAANGVVVPEVGKPVLLAWDKNIKTVTQLSIRSCGGAKEWLYGKILCTGSYDIEDKSVENPLYDMRDLMFYPHLSGEKVLHGNPKVRGAFFGLDLETSRSELQRALMEGTAFALRSLKEAVDNSESWGEILLVGGGSKNNFWAQTLSDILGIRMVRAKTTGAGHGAALLALSAAEHKSLESIASRACELLDVIVPDSRAKELYDQRYRRYLRIYDALEQIYMV